MIIHDNTTTEWEKPENSIAIGKNVQYHEMIHLAMTNVKHWQFVLRKAPGHSGSVWKANAAQSLPFSLHLAVLFFP